MKTCLAIILVAAGAVFASVSQSQAQELNCSLERTNIVLDTIDTVGAETSEGTGKLTITCSNAQSVLYACVKLSTGTVLPLTNGHDDMVVTLASNDTGTVNYTSSYSEAMVLNQVGDKLVRDFDVYADVANKPWASVGMYTAAEKFTVGVTDQSNGNCSGGLLAETTETLDISGNVVPDCDISVTDIEFGIVDILNDDNTKTGTITGDCTPGITYRIRLDDGDHFGDGSRRMESGSNYISYELYQDNGYTRRWGSSETEQVSAFQDYGASHYDHTVFAKIPKQNAPSGSYVDTVTATIFYSEEEN